MLAVFRSKTARVALFYVLLCGGLLAWSNRARLSLCGEWRQAALRELCLNGPEADVLFLGSSRTARGLMPSEFEERWRELTGQETTALNLAVMGVPRHVMFNALVSWLARHRAPRVIVVEMSDTDLVEWPHPNLDDWVLPHDALRVLAARPYAYRDSAHYSRENPGPKDLERRLVHFDPGGVFNAFEVWQLNIDIALRALGRGPEDVSRVPYNQVKNGLAGRGWSNPYWRQDEVPDVPEIMPEVTRAQVEAQGWYRIAPESRDGVYGKQQVEALAAGDPEPWVRSGDQPFGDPRRYRPSKRYARELLQLCRAHGIRLVFMELPGFRSQAGEAQVRFHRALAPLFQADPAELQVPEMFQDPGHLSIEGARWYSRRLAEWLALELE